MKSTIGPLIGREWYRIAIGICSLLFATSVVGSDSSPSLASTFERDVRVLASDRMEGRGLGTQGLERAADWIETQLRDTLKPAFPEHSYRQPCRVKTGVALVEGNRLSGLPASDWTPRGMSSSGPFLGD